VGQYRRTLGQIYKAAGLVANARRELEVALRIDPKDAEAKQELRGLAKK
jgi:Tfp pilus assembly protein PilF